MTASPITHPRTPTLPRPAVRWARRYAIRLAATDTVVVAVTVIAAHLVWFDGIRTISAHSGPPLQVSTAQASLALLVLWLGALAIVDSREEDEIGGGTTEYRRVLAASVGVFLLTLVGGFFLGLDMSRLWVITVFPLGTLALLIERWSWRQWLVAERRNGRYGRRIVLVGDRGTVSLTARDLARNPGHGYHVVGVALTDGPDRGMHEDLPIVGSVDEVPSALSQYGADTVVATASAALTPERIRDLAWQLEPRRHHLFVAPSLTDVGGSRIRLRPVAGLPLIDVETPHYTGAKRHLKRTFDVLAASAALIILAPVLAAIAIAVRRDSPGGVFYTQERIGRDGEPFRILKFRSMYADADARRAELIAVSDADPRRFKMQDDPRITPVGRVLRKYSLDELPQLWNVLRGDMSLVGPRPALASEVSEYDRRELRRLAVTPGLSGLWQVSGRSNLGWADGIRLDLYYVENWSLTQDLVILMRTARAVFTSDGAY